MFTSFPDVADKCKRIHDPGDDDGLDSLVSALSPSYTSRFGEIVWAASFGSPAPAYVATDLSGDGIPDISDLSTVWANTFNSLFYARP